SVAVGLNLHDLVVDVADTELADTMLLQKWREFSSIEMVGIVCKPGEFGCRDQLRRECLATQLGLKAHAGGKTCLRQTFQPVRCQIAVGVVGRQSEWMPVGVRVTRVHPFDELRSLLERGVTLTQKVSLRDADLFERGAN